MLSKSDDIFTKISDPLEKEKILRGIVLARKDMLIKCSDSLVSLPRSSNQEKSEGGILIGTPILFQSGKIFCRSSFKLSTSTQVVVQMSTGEDKYLCLSTCHPSGDGFCLDMEGQIFKLQRREEFRLKIPSGYYAILKILLIANHPIDGNLPLVDLSAGGCKVEVKANFYKAQTGDRFRAELRLKGREPIFVNGNIRYISKHPLYSQQQVWGVEFSDMSTQLKDKLAGFTMDIYRELFSRMSVN